MEDVCRRFVVSGRVQGVFYRDTTCRKACELCLTGWIRNQDDGSVEVLACGAPHQLALLAAWLRQGPPLASVEKVEEVPVTFEEHPRFEVR